MSPASSLRRRLQRRLVCLLALPASIFLGGGAFAPSVQAQALGRPAKAPIDLQVFRPAVDSKGFITLNASQILGPKDFSFGLVSTWSRRPLQLEGTVEGQD